MQYIQVINSIWRCSAYFGHDEYHFAKKADIITESEYAYVKTYSATGTSQWFIRDKRLNWVPVPNREIPRAVVSLLYRTLKK